MITAGKRLTIFRRLLSITIFMGECYARAGTHTYLISHARWATAGGHLYARPPAPASHSHSRGHRSPPGIAAQAAALYSLLERRVSRRPLPIRWAYYSLS